MPYHPSTKAMRAVAEAVAARAQQTSANTLTPGEYSNRMVGNPYWDWSGRGRTIDQDFLPLIGEPSQPGSRLPRPPVSPYPYDPNAPMSMNTQPRIQQASLRSTVGSAAKAVGSAVSDTKRAMSDFGYSIRDKTSSSGFVGGMQGMFDAMRQAAADAGLSRLAVVAGKGQGHLSHAHGTEADIVGYNADGSTWSKAQRVAVARGASLAGGNRFGFYSGPTLHVGLGYAGAPKNVVWNNKLRGVPGVTTFAPEERDFVTALRTGKLASYAPRATAPTGQSMGDPQVAQLQQNLNAQGAGITVDGIMGPQTRAAMAKYQAPAQAYASAPATTPALQAAAGQAAGTSGYQRSPQIAQMQRDLNSRGAALKVDGIRGPLTMAAEKQFLGSPISVRTPSFTAGRTITPYTSGQQDAGVGLPRQNAPPVARPSYVPTPSFTARASPYTNSTGGAYTSGRGDEGRGVPAPLSMNTRNMRVPTQTVPRYQVAPVGANQTAFNTAPQQWSSLQQPTVPTARAPLQWSSLQSPYTSSTGGANAIQAPRIPQPRPAYPPPSLPAPAGPTMWQQMQDEARRVAAVAAQVAQQAKDSYSQSTRSGMGYQGGGGYSGGSYGGAGGRSISSGVGGAFRNR